jgi:tetratricopeptide (TPR) repeat protein
LNFHSEDILSDIWFLDHGDGSSRVEKASRDLRLLSEAMRLDQDNARYWFYLAQTYWDEGRIAEAASAYARRAEMSGFAEKTWYARLQRARCLLALGDEFGFFTEALAAYKERPHRAEPLYDLARFYRERGLYEVAVLYCEAGLALRWPEDDTLFIDDFTYSTGLREELSIAGYYCQNSRRKEQGRRACESLAIDDEAPIASRELATKNLVFYEK